MKLSKIIIIAWSIMLIVVIIVPFVLTTNAETEIETTTSIVSTTIEEDNTPKVQVNQREWDLLAAAIYYEAGSDDCTDRHQQLVAQVILNRVTSNEFPNSVYDVITQNYPTVQYSSCYKIIDMAECPDTIPQRCYYNALVALKGEVECPANIVWQANFRQGSSVYEIHKTSYSTTYFCHR